jgi:eukaryotic-like serine/threonine-protein kinase
MNPADEPLLGRRVCHYQITEWLGAGGMGVVYRALDEKLGRAVALKFLPPEASSPYEKRRFVQEARAASALDHPNIGVIHGLEETPEGRLFIVMAYYDGETLAARLRRGPLPEAQVLDIGHQIALGLAEAHSKGMIHRDVKPGNIMISRQNLVKLLDFGLAKLSHVDTVTRSGVTSGTPAYMSPEQAMGQTVDHRSDIWALGVVLFEMLSGQRPFVRDNIPSTMLAITQDPPAPLDQPRAALQAVVYKCLAKNPAQRYQAAEHVADDLAEMGKARDTVTQTLNMHAGDLEQARGGASMQATGLAIPTSPPKRSRKQLAALTVLVALLAAGSWYAASKWSGPPMPREKHVAVLPFTNIGGDAAIAAICDGMLETLTSRLNGLEQGKESLWVAPSSEVRRRNVADAETAKRVFGANLVVTGAVQKNADGVRLTVNLIDTRTLRLLGSKVIDDRFGNFATLQDNAVTELAKMLAVESASNAAPRPNGESAMPAAYESYLKGLSYLQRYDKPGNLDTAIQLFDVAVKSDPRFALAFSRRGEAERLKYRLNHERALLDGALADAKHGAEINDQLAPVHVTLAQVHSEGGNYDLAVQEFQKALALDPRNAEAYQYLATTYESQGRLAEAEASIKKAIALRPDHWAGYNTLGTFYYRRGKFSEAAAQYRKVIELTPDNASAYINLGVMLKNLDDQAGARQAYEQSIAINPSYAAYSNLAGILYNEANYLRAAEVYEKALHMNDRDYRPWGGLATAYFAAGLPDKARPALERAAGLAEDEVARRPTDATTLSYLALYYAKLGSRDKGLSRMETALVLAPGDQRILYMAAVTHETLGDRAAALKWLKAALGKGYPAASVPRDPDLRKLREDPAFRFLVK